MIENMKVFKEGFFKPGMAVRVTHIGTGVSVSYLVEKCKYPSGTVLLKIHTGETVSFTVEDLREGTSDTNPTFFLSNESLVIERYCDIIDENISLKKSTVKLAEVISELIRMTSVDILELDRFISHDAHTGVSKDGAHIVAKAMNLMGVK